MKLADALVTTLRDWGLECAFGVGGANIEHFYDAVHRLGEGRFQIVAAKSEIGAAFMADCRARVHRTLGVCCATSGGGMMNLAVGVAEAYAESVPLLALVGQPPAQFAGRGAFQDSSGIGRTVDANKLWSAITKYCAVLDDPSQFWSCLESAVREALSGRPGPSVLLIPRDAFDSEVGDRPASLPHRLDEFKTAPAICENKIRDLFDAIQAASAPVLLVGSGVDRCGNPQAVIDFARRAGIRVATTLSSKNSFPNDDPQYLGMVGMAGEPSAHRYLCDEADLIVAVGTGLNMMTTQPIQQALRPERLAVVNIDLGEVLRVVTPARCLEADAGVVFTKLNHICDQEGVVPRAVGKARLARFAPQLAPRIKSHEFGFRQDAWRGELLQSDALEVLQQFLPTSGHILFDAGNCAAAALHYLRIPRAVSTTCALGMGGMGYAVSAAVGAQLGSTSGSRTMVFCGDGAFLMQGAEVNTAVHYRLPILFVVFNNGMHGMCVTRQQLYFDGRIEGAQYPAISVEDFARGLGGRDRLWVGSAGDTCELGKCLANYAAMADGPGVLELRLEREQIPPFTPFLAGDAPTYDAVSFVGA